MRYIILQKFSSGQIFGRNADPDRPYVWQQICASDDRELLEDMIYKMTDGDKKQARNYKILDKEDEHKNGKSKY